jgi:hypothetical protein
MEGDRSELLMVKSRQHSETSKGIVPQIGYGGQSVFWFAFAFPFEIRTDVDTALDTSLSDELRLYVGLYNVGPAMDIRELTDRVDPLL